MPSVTPKQLDILTLLYRFRFLSRTHIQRLLNHKHHSLILTWLNDLAANNYITQHYTKQIISAPATYELTPQGTTYLKTQLKKKLAKQTKYTEALKNHCLAVADTYFALSEQAKKSGVTLYFSTKPDLARIQHLPKPLPEAYVAIEELNGVTRRYFLEVLEDVPSRLLRARVIRYISYFESDDWQDHTDKPFPGIVLVCPNPRIKVHLGHYLRSRLGDEPELEFRLCTLDSLDLTQEN